MKRLITVCIAVLMASLSQAQQVDVDVNPDKIVEVSTEMAMMAVAEMDLNRIVETALNGVKIEVDPFGKGKSKSKWLQQDVKEIEIPLTSPGERGTLSVESHNGRVTINGYDGPTVKVKMIKFGKKVSNERSTGGMRRIASGSFNVEAEEYRNVVKVESEGWGDRIDFEIQVPKNFNIKAESYNNGHILIEDIEGVLEVESYNGPITLRGISGAAIASTYNGAVKVEFTSLTADTPMAFSTYNGDVDITIPSGAKLTTKMKTNKDIFTDFDSFSVEDSTPRRSENRRGGYRIKLENWTIGKLNGGGAEVMMKTTNGNIYIRKNG